MKRALAGLVVAGALLIPGHFATATATASPAPVADSGSSSTGSGCTSSQPPTCSSPLAYLFIQLVEALATGSAAAR
ncbi:hypothetical protein OHA40_13570 [Nocardia sp. NBC_00508]|uniref:hypothetical protein n=1 Tax=Nocardia sp. NBC_00508 TaxID=2975992 RepID=UPI002E81A93F|nr:hypothetical protein [Nocardia sp. NBC_00508]WUD69057.1 hypothetical protein OHA40_13570 [Nocardia sp. NBC_00508]